MNNFEFVSHEEFPEDKFIKEAVTVCFEGKYRICYLRKQLPNGAKFWNIMQANAEKNGVSIKLKSFIPNDNFLQEDVMHFLESRGWENLPKPIPKKAEYAKNDDEVPF